MNKKLQSKLVKKYPDMFKDVGGNSRTSPIALGIECGDGWYDLVDSLCHDIIEIANKKNLEIIVLQIKEKFGGLRFYYIAIGRKTSLTAIRYLIREFAFNKRLGKQYWKIVELRGKFWKTPIEKISDLVKKAEFNSYSICETCGKPGMQFGGGWIKVLCEECNKKYKKGKRSWQDGWGE